MVATTNLVLYNSSELIIIAEVFPGNSYAIPNDVEIYIGTLEDFLIDNPEYSNDIKENNL